MTASISFTQPARRRHSQRCHRPRVARPRRVGTDRASDLAQVVRRTELRRSSRIACWIGLVELRWLRCAGPATTNSGCVWSSSVPAVHAEPSAQSRAPLLHELHRATGMVASTSPFSTAPTWCTSTRSATGWPRPSPPAWAVASPRTAAPRQGDPGVRRGSRRLSTVRLAEPASRSPRPPSWGRNWPRCALTVSRSTARSRWQASVASPRPSAGPATP